MRPATRWRPNRHTRHPYARWWPSSATCARTRDACASTPSARAGNADPLLPQTTALVERLDGLGVETDTLLFPPDTSPPLGHEYQFLLDTPAGREALSRILAFLARRV